MPIDTRIPLDISLSKLLIETPYGRVASNALPDQDTAVGFLLYSLFKQRAALFGVLQRVYLENIDSFPDELQDSINTLVKEGV